ncbi:MAG: Rieske (2Fe-2S) protein [Anaerolineales bacterium]
MENENSALISRRSFLHLAYATLGSIAFLESGLILFQYLQPRLGEGEFGTRIKAGLVGDFPPNSVTYISNGRFYLVRLADGGFLALYQRCTHLGCTVTWEPKENRFVCPCHSSQFDQQGNVENPPATHALDRFDVEIANGEVWVDTAKPLPRQSFDLSQVTYP